MSTLLNQLAKDRATARVEALAAWNQLARRADEPQEGDVAALELAMGTLGLAVGDFAGDADALAEHAALADFLQTPEDLQAARDAFSKWDEKERAKRAKLQAGADALRNRLYSFSDARLSPAETAKLAASGEVAVVREAYDAAEREVRAYDEAHGQEFARRLGERDAILNAHASAWYRRGELERQHSRVFGPDRVPVTVGVPAEEVVMNFGEGRPAPVASTYTGG